MMKCQYSYLSYVKFMAAVNVPFMQNIPNVQTAVTHTERTTFEATFGLVRNYYDATIAPRTQPLTTTTSQTATQVPARFRDKDRRRV